MSNENVPGTEVIVPDRVDMSKTCSKNAEYHEKRIRQHYSNGPSLSELTSLDDISTEVLMKSLLGEFAREIDNLAGNNTIAIENGDIEASTIIATKRAEIVDRLYKAVMTKKEFEASTSLDVESPSMRVVFQYFLEKSQESFDRAGMTSEISDVFFRNFNDICGSTWKKELKRRIAEIKS